MRELRVQSKKADELTDNEFQKKKTEERAEKLGEIRIHWLLQGVEGSIGSREW